MYGITPGTSPNYLHGTRLDTDFHLWLYILIEIDTAGLKSRCSIRFSSTNIFGQTYSNMRILNHRFHAVLRYSQAKRTTELSSLLFNSFRFSRIRKNRTKLTNQLNLTSPVQFSYIIVLLLPLSSDIFSVLFISVSCRSLSRCSGRAWYAVPQ